MRIAINSSEESLKEITHKKFSLFLDKARSYAEKHFLPWVTDPGLLICGLGEDEELARVIGKIFLGHTFSEEERQVVLELPSHSCTVRVGEFLDFIPADTKARAKDYPLAVFVKQQIQAFVDGQQDSLDEFLWQYVFPFPSSTHRVEASVRAFNVMLKNRPNMKDDNISLLLRASASLSDLKTEFAAKQADREVHTFQYNQHVRGGIAVSEAAKRKGDYGQRKRREKFKNLTWRRFLLKKHREMQPGKDEFKRIRRVLEQNQYSAKIRYEKLQETIRQRAQNSAAEFNQLSVDARQNIVTQQSIERTPAVLGYIKMSKLSARGLERELEYRGFFTGGTRYKTRNLNNVLKLYSEREGVPRTCVNPKVTHTPDDDKDLCSIFRVVDRDLALPQNLEALRQWEIDFAGLDTNEQDKLRNGYDDQEFECETCDFRGTYYVVLEHENNCNE